MWYQIVLNRRDVFIQLDKKNTPPRHQAKCREYGTHDHHRVQELWLAPKQTNIIYAQIKLLLLPPPQLLILILFILLLLTMDVPVEPRRMQHQTIIG
jgi:hypothetical protein